MNQKWNSETIDAMIMRIEQLEKMLQFNQLTPAEAERLTLCLEEMSEATQIIGKIFRHGYESTHPNGGPTNRQILERELGDVRHSIIRLCESGDLSKKKIHFWAHIKAQKVKPFLHHQEDSAHDNKPIYLMPGRTNWVDNNE